MLLLQVTYRNNKSDADKIQEKWERGGGGQVQLYISEIWELHMVFPELTGLYESVYKLLKYFHSSLWAESGHGQTRSARGRYNGIYLTNPVQRPIFV
ncbi:MAG: hypothetical protein CSA81_14415 [Acidobacteria bacterium]|nr:MAG: hypothetical protein CSA81_14415 [Acidobacteriota bacterium]